MKKTKRIKRILAGILSAVVLVGLIGPVNSALAEAAAHSGPIVLSSSATTPSASIGLQFTIQTPNADACLPAGTYYNSIKLNGFDTEDGMELQSEGDGSYKVVHWGLVKAGNVLSIEGTFSRGGVSVTFPKTEFTLNGDATNGYYWTLSSDSIGVQVTDVSLIDASKTEGVGNNLRVKFTTETAFPKAETTFQRGVDAVLNHNGVWMNAYLHAYEENGYYQLLMDWADPLVQSGDEVTIAGTFQNADGSFIITFPQTTFVCRGDAEKGYYWKLKSEPDVLQAEELTLTSASKTGSANNYKRIQFITGTMVPDTGTIFQPETDAVLTREGEWMDAYLYGHPDIPYYQIVMDDAVPATTTGDIITIAGTFSNSAGTLSITLPETSFKCVGDASSGYYWQLESTLSVLESGVVGVAEESSVSGADTDRIVLETEASAPVREIYFKPDSDGTIFRNGQEVDAYLYSDGNGRYMIVAENAQPANTAGDIITISGTFIEEGGKWSIRFPETSFQCMSDGGNDCYWIVDYGMKTITLSQGQSRDTDFQFTIPGARNIPLDNDKLKALDELNSGIYMNGEKISGTIAKIDTAIFELDLKSYAAQAGDTVTIQGSFAAEKYIVSFQHFSAQYKQGVWSTVDTASGKVTMLDTVVDLEQIPEGYTIETGSTVTTDRGATLTDEAIQKPGNYIFSRMLGNIQYVKNIVVYRKGDVHIDDTLDVKDLVAMLKVQKDASKYGEAEGLASEVLNERTTDENREALRNMLVNNGMYVPKGTPTYADDRYIELAAFCGPRRAGYRVWNGSLGGHPEDPEGGWDSFITEKNFQDYMDAGFTYLLTEGDAGYSANFEGSDLQAYMNLAEKMNIPVVVNSGELTAMALGTSHQLTQNNKNYLDNMLADLSVYNCFKGLTLKDEPNIVNAKAFGSIQDYVWTKKPNLFFFTSMLPIYAKTSSFYENATENKDVAYQEYVRSFANATNTFAYDYYPLWSQPNKILNQVIGQKNYVRTDYYHNFEVVAQDAKRNSYDAGMVVQSSSWGSMNGESTTSHPRKTNTKADIGFQVYSSLAYGMKYITYYTYWEHWSQGDADSYVYDAMVLYPDNKGEEPIKTDTYYAVQAVNQEIKKFDHIFMRYGWQGSMAVVPSRASKSELLSGVKDYKSSRIGEVTATQETLIGCMKDENGYDGFWIVNATEPSQDKTDQVTIEFKQASSAICYIDGEEQRVGLQGGKCTLNIGAGEGIFVIPVQ